jgi:hypothetical protein
MGKTRFSVLRPLGADSIVNATEAQRGTGFGWTCGKNQTISTGGKRAVADFEQDKLSRGP